MEPVSLITTTIKGIIYVISGIAGYIGIEYLFNMMG